MKKKNLRWNVIMEYKTNYNKDNAISIISEIFSKKSCDIEMFKIIENRKFWKIEKIEYSG